MEIIERTVDAITILDLSGELTIGEGAQLLKDKSESLVFWHSEAKLRGFDTVLAQLKRFCGNRWDWN